MDHDFLPLMSLGLLEGFVDMNVPFLEVLLTFLKANGEFSFVT
jgi:hypothetical protein